MSKQRQQHVIHFKYAHFFTYCIIKENSQVIDSLGTFFDKLKPNFILSNRIRYTENTIFILGIKMLFYSKKF